MLAKNRLLLFDPLLLLLTLVVIIMRESVSSATEFPRSSISSDWLLTSGGMPVRVGAAIGEDQDNTRMRTSGSG